ncbi:unnamed protein product [Moneuplotes crassus]|uniref:Uncharacterized protein n=1 Tax=Euplotes crassus TaxID=5936 RepID=A0AAD1Y8B0_EUPCR|nr:unnamed protein product [Moneuplotes crassus]
MVIEPLSVNFREFDTRFTMTCFNLPLSDKIGRSLIFSCILMLNSSPFPSICSINISWISCMHCAIVKTWLFTWKTPEAILACSKMSSTNILRILQEDEAIWTKRLFLPYSSVFINSREPMIEFRGVLNSWETLASIWRC